ncbi:glycosyltransferase [Mucilaginibacter celer]|uniref:Glycosyltransferase n=1 Tax=Mucilaginibacter celer TaxID=2305508 RepID=A0A494VJD3_9SPHI|nr:glycosyltransferase [Mucilaginibacter celer]AYL95126.1 glycosyltransferase [Mucilaginibacter celer]
MLDITISIVLFHTNENELKNVLNLINKSSLRKKIYLIDNSANSDLSWFSNFENVQYIYTGKNIGYGSGHNIAINKAGGSSKYHLIMNSDVEFNHDILQNAFTFMEANPEVGLISPTILNTSGDIQHFCRKLPTPFDLFARRFIPNFLKPAIQKKLDSYILTDKDYSAIMNIPNLPGCFMFTRTSTLVSCGGFDENFFLYVEDVDLCRRMHEISSTLYYPKIKITHTLAQGSYKSSKLALYHIASAIYYFNKWGWLNDKGRIAINNSITQNDNLFYVSRPASTLYLSQVVDTALYKSA